MFQIELPTLPKLRQLFQIKLRAHKQGLVLRWKSFVLPFRSSSVITAKISDIRPKTVGQKLNVLSVEKATHTKDAQTERKSNQNVRIAKDHMLETIKGVQLTKKGILSTCSGQPKNLCLHFKAKLGPASTTQG